MKKAVIRDAIYWLDSFPSYNGLSYALCTATILQGLPIQNYDKLTIGYISYAQLHTGTDSTTKSITIGMIPL